MRRISAFVLLSSGCLLALAVPSADAQTWDLGKVYEAEVGGGANTLRYIDPDGGFLGWVTGSTTGTITHLAPDEVSQISGEYGDFFQIEVGKEKHLTTNWGLDGQASTRTALFWRIYIPSSPPITEFPSIQFKTHDLEHHLDFKPDVTDGGGCAPGTAGWVGARGSTIDSGGKIIPDGSGDRYLPMSMNEWHTIRVEVLGSGQFEAWIDEEQGLNDIQHVSVDATHDGAGDYIEIGVRNSGHSTQYYTNFLAFGQDTTATGGVDEIEPLPSVPMEMCSNGQDDDGDGLIDCDEPGCLCDLRPEICSNGIDDDGDGLFDCGDPDCENAGNCSDTSPHFALTLCRQIGNWQNGCGDICNSGVYFSAYDEDGNPLNGVTLSDPLNCIQVTTFDPDGGGDQQGGHVRHLPWDALQPTEHRFYVASLDGMLVSSDVTPVLHANLPPFYERSAWQIEFQLISEKWDTGAYTPTEPTYIFDAVELNEPPGDNPTLPDDRSGLPDVDYPIGEAGVMIGQTFTANCNRIISARVEATIGFHLKFQYELSVHDLLNNPPVSMSDIGPQIGPTRTGPPDMFDSEFWQQMVLWPLQGPDSVPVTPGEAYFLKIARTDLPGGELSVFVSNPDEDYYSGGMQFRQPLIGPFGNDDPEYDVVGYIVGATVGGAPDPCRVYDPVFDVNDDGKVDSQDYVAFENCATGPDVPMDPSAPLECQCMDIDEDEDIDQDEFGAFQICFTGPLGTVDPACDDY